MNKLNVGIFISGAGTTLRAVNEAINNNILQMNIDFVVIGVVFEVKLLLPDSVLFEEARMKGGLPPFCLNVPV